MNGRNVNLKKINEYIDFIINSNFTGREVLKREYLGVTEHDDKDLVIATEVYNDLKKMCTDYKKGKIDSKTLSDFSFKTMYSKYSPKIVSKIVADEIFDSLDYISELDFNLKKI